MSGAVLNFTAADLAATAAAYNPALWRAPLVAGHPALDGPAYGHVGALAFAGGALEATPVNVNAEFAAQVNAGAYSSVSLCLWRPQAPGNPVPGVYYPRHLGFLGAHPPAILGMRTPAFAADQVARYAAAAGDLVEFSAWDEVDGASLWRTVRDWILGKWGPADADAAVPAYLVASIERAAQRELAIEQAAVADVVDPTPAGAMAPAFAAAGSRTQETPTVTEAEKLALQADNARLRQQITDAAAAAQTAALAAAESHGLAFADSLVQQGRLAVDHRSAVGALFTAVATVEQAQGAVLQYGAAEARAPLLPVITALLGTLPVQVPTGRLATAGNAGAGEGGTVGFAARDGAQVEPGSLAVHLKVQAYQRAHAGTDYAAALGAVMAGSV